MNEENISQEDYNHAQLVWDSFKIKNLGEYSDLYLKTDVLLLADIFFNFWISCLESYGLDIYHYITLAAFSWDAMLKFTKIILEKLTSINKLNVIEQGEVLHSIKI